MLPREHLIQMLHYDPDTGIFTWLNPPVYHPRMKLQVAGAANDLGYIAIKIYGKKYNAHRLAWLYIYGEYPNIIDHINRNPSDNRISNLRDVDHYINAQNNGKNGGIRRLPHGKYQARIRRFNKTISGTFNTHEEARRALDEYCKNDTRFA